MRATTSKSNRIPRFPEKYERFVKRICGSDWKYSSNIDLEGGIGVAVCKAIIDGQNINLVEIAEYLGVDTELLATPYERLSKNGFMKNGKLSSDEDLVKSNSTAWCYLAGVAGGATGIGS